MIQLPEPKKDLNKAVPKKYGHKKEAIAALDVDKMMFLMGKLSSLRKSEPGMFKDLQVDHQTEEIGRYSDHQIIMKINNCTEASIRNNPALYLAMNREAWNRNLMKDKS